MMTLWYFSVKWLPTAASAKLLVLNQLCIQLRLSTVRVSVKEGTVSFFHRLNISTPSTSKLSLFGFDRQIKLYAIYFIRLKTV